MMTNLRSLCLASWIAVMPVLAIAQQQVKDTEQKIQISLQKRIPAADKETYVITRDFQKWDPTETAIIICDMWDQHWCRSATDRVNELAPKINEVIAIARARGVLIVHAPSDCMEYYRDHAGRKRALRYKTAPFEKVISADKLPSENGAEWPVDQSDWGCGDLPVCTRRLVWVKESEKITIGSADAISDSGIEMAGLFSDRGIKNVIMMGVHTNMCIIDRTFGLRNMVRLGMNVVLMRDLTDAMYNQRRWPHVSHFEGTELVIAYIEKYICPTITSHDFTGRDPFRFSGNKSVYKKPNK